jgi:hypothetical protein
MANMESGGASNPKMIKATGTGTDLDPFLIEYALTASQLAQLADGMISALASLPAHYERSRMWKNKGSDTAANRRTLVSPDRITVNVNNVGYVKQAEQELDLNVVATWDTIVGTDYTVAANRAGKTFRVYACQPISGLVPVLIVSAASTFPAGYTALTSRKIALFHCECLNVGTISGHSLTGYLTGDILPRSIQDLKHRPNGNREFKDGFVWGGITDFDALNYAPIWKAIYMASGTGINMASVFGATTKVSYDWNQFVADFGLIGCRMMTDGEFQVLCTGIEEEVNISGSVSPITAGGHVSTTGRRMISNIGSEDDAGVWWQWLSTQSFRVDFDGSVVTAAKTANVIHAAAPGGNPVYVDYMADGSPYLCCNMATTGVDKWVVFGSTYAVLIRHLASIPASAVQVYLDEDATQPGRLLAVMGRAKNSYIPGYPNTAFKLQITHNANAATLGVAVNFDDGADQRLEFISPTAATGVVDMALDAIAWAYYNLATGVGSLYCQGVYGDVKLLAGGYWNAAAFAGSRCRYANIYRWFAGASFGGRPATD